MVAKAIKLGLWDKHPAYCQDWKYYVTFLFQSNTSILSSLRNQLLKEMSAIVSSGVKKGVKSQDGDAGDEVTVQETVTEHDVHVRHQDEETLEILQGAWFAVK